MMVHSSFRLIRALLMSIIFFGSSFSASYDIQPYQWAVIGAGPAGIIAVAQLIDLGIPATKIVWFDPKFKVGRIGTCYRNVPANSRANELSMLLRSCHIFSQCSSESITALHNYPPYAEFYLRSIADPLLDITHNLCTRGITKIHATVNSLVYEESFWHITAEQQHIQTHNAILATGAEPLSLSYQGPTEIQLDSALDQSLLATMVGPEDTVAVFGSGASAILLLKYLSEITVKQVINFYKHHHSQARKRRQSKTIFAAMH